MLSEPLEKRFDLVGMGEMAKKDGAYLHVQSVHVDLASRLGQGIYVGEMGGY